MVSLVGAKTPMGTFLCPEGFCGPQGLRALSREGSAVTEFVRLVLRHHGDRRDRDEASYVKTRTSDPVLLVPGFMAGDSTLLAIRRFLRRHGYRTYRSAIHANVRCTREATDRLEQRVESIVERRDRPVRIIGHSLGGMLARALAARRPDLVSGIVTMGSPVLAPAAVHQVLTWDLDLLVRLTRVGIGGLMSADCIAGDCARTAQAESKAPLPAGFPFTAIYSKRDGIVDWRACLDPAARHVEVPTSHCGMAIDPLVMDELLRALTARPAGARRVRASRAAARPASAAAPLAART